MTQNMRRSIGNGVHFLGIQDPKFKTMRISVHFILPLDRETVCVNAMLPFLMGRAGGEYPDFTQLSRRLDDLYGAGLNTDAGKIGDAQILSFSITGLSSRYAFMGENMSLELAGMLKGLIFSPALSEGKFREEDIRQEKRQICELIDSDMNDKRLYAKRRCEMLLADGENWGLNPYGTKEGIEAVSSEELTKAWEHMLRTSQVEILATGDCDASGIEALFKDAFAHIKREDVFEYRSFPLQKERELRRISETAGVAQSKLVMGFQTGINPQDSRMAAAKVMIGMFGGSPTSKLFMNVREKLSLCYYCSTAFSGAKGILYVQSGTESINLKRVEEEVLVQLEKMKAGEFTKEEMLSVKRSMRNSYTSLSDSLSALEGWYFSQILTGSLSTPQEACAAMEAVTEKDITEAAAAVRLDTIFSLIGNGGAQA